MNMERTLVLIKPDGIRRSLIGKIISRFEDAGLKLVAMKMLHADMDLAQKHYLHEDLAKRAGEKVWQRMTQFLTSDPIVAMIVEGPRAISVVRKLIGSTEPASAIPGTIRGDMCCVNYELSDNLDIACKNLVHASEDNISSEREIEIWFNSYEICPYFSHVNVEYIKNVVSG